MLYLISQDEKPKGSCDTLTQALDRAKELQSRMPSWSTIWIDSLTANYRQKTIRIFSKHDSIK